MNMPKIRNIIRGKRNKASGQQFEQLLESSANKQKWEVIKIPDGCRQIGPGKMIRVKSAFDFVFAKKNRCIFIDAKSCAAKTFGSSAVTPHQVLKLSRLQSQGFLAGYIVFFSKLNIVSFFPAMDLYALKFRESLNPEQGIVIGNKKDISLDILIQEI